MNFVRLGTDPSFDDVKSRKIVYSNIVFISLPIVYFVFMVIDYRSFLMPISEMIFDQLVVPIIIVICFFCLWLNSLGKTKISRVLFIGVWPFLLHLIPVILLKTPEDYYLAFPFGVVFHSILIQFMFSYHKERWLFWMCIILNFSTMILAPTILMYFDRAEDIPTEMVDRTYLLVGILYWLLFNLVTFYVLYEVELYIKKLSDSKELIHKQKEELNSMNQNLEELISQRTAELKHQNEKLGKHAYFNAHLLRGPFCRVQGLLQLQDLDTQTSTDSIEIREKLNESIDELDKRIREIQKVVESPKKHL